LGKALRGPKRTHLWKTEPNYEVMNTFPGGIGRGDTVAALEDIKHCIGRKWRCFNLVGTKGRQSAFEIPYQFMASNIHGRQRGSSFAWSMAMLPELEAVKTITSIASSCCTMARQATISRGHDGIDGPRGTMASMGHDDDALSTSAMC